MNDFELTVPDPYANNLIKANETAKVQATGLSNGTPNSTAPQNCVRCRKSVSNTLKTAPTPHIS